jgi:hypothetical protein
MVRINLEPAVANDVCMSAEGQRTQSERQARWGPPRWVWLFVAIVLVALLAITALFWTLSKAPALFEFLGQRQLVDLRSEIKPGMSRQRVYTLLRARRLVAWNTAYAIDRRDPKTGDLYVVREGDWPPATFTAVDLNGKAKGLVSHPQVYVTIPLGSRAFGCSEDVDLAIEFDVHDLVKSVNPGLPQHECM